jgi:serine/threonine protein phosphatase PrpC
MAACSSGLTLLPLVPLLLLPPLLQLGLFCVFDGHHSRTASEQAQELLPQLLAQNLPQQQQQQQQQHCDPPHDNRDITADAASNSNKCFQRPSSKQQQPQQQQPLLSDEAGVAAALTCSFLETDRQLTCDDGCTATAVLLEGCRDGCVLLRVANVGDSMALLVDLGR